MRTQQAREVRDKAVSEATNLGHSPKLLTRSGAMELWVCENGCNCGHRQRQHGSCPMQKPPA
jgi:hypothetical protein